MPSIHVTARGDERKPTRLPTDRSSAMIATGSGIHQVIKRLEGKARPIPGCP